MNRESCINCHFISLRLCHGKKLQWWWSIVKQESDSSTVHTILPTKCLKTTTYITWLNLGIRQDLLLTGFVFAINLMCFLRNIIHILFLLMVSPLGMLTSLGLLLFLYYQSLANSLYFHFTVISELFKKLTHAFIFRAVVLKTLNNRCAAKVC